MEVLANGRRQQKRREAVVKSYVDNARYAESVGEFVDTQSDNLSMVGYGLAAAGAVASATGVGAIGGIPVAGFGLATSVIGEGVGAANAALSFGSNLMHNYSDSKQSVGYEQNRGIGNIIQDYAKNGGDPELVRQATTLYNNRTGTDFLGSSTSATGEIIDNLGSKIQTFGKSIQKVPNKFVKGAGKVVNGAG